MNREQQGAIQIGQEGKITFDERPDQQSPMWGEEEYRVSAKALRQKNSLCVQEDTDWSGVSKRRMVRYEVREVEKNESSF